MTVEELYEKKLKAWQDENPQAHILDHKKNQLRREAERELNGSAESTVQTEAARPTFRIPPAQASDNITEQIIAEAKQDACRVQVEMPLLPEVSEEEDFTVSAEEALPYTTPQRATARRGSRFVLTNEYEAILEWADKTMYCSVDQLAVYLGVNKARARKLAENLVEQKLLASKFETGCPKVFCLTQLGKDTIGSDTNAVSAETGVKLARHALEVGWVMLKMIKSVAITSNGTRQYLSLDNFVSESQIIRSKNKKWGLIKTDLEDRASRLNKASGRFTGGTTTKEADIAIAREAMRVRAAGRAFHKGNEWTLAMYGTGGDKPHIPDLMLLVPGRNVAVAIEVERKQNPASVEHMVKSYKSNLLQAPLLRAMNPAHFDPDFTDAEAEAFGAALQSVGDRYREDMMRSYVKAMEADPREWQPSNQIGGLPYGMLIPSLSAWKAYFRYKGDAVDDYKIIQATHWYCGSERVRSIVETAYLEQFDLNPDEWFEYPTALKDLQQDLKLLPDEVAWREGALARLEADALVARTARVASIAEKQWHLTTRLEVKHCLCGVNCVAAHGRFKNRSMAEARRKSLAGS